MVGKPPAEEIIVNPSTDHPDRHHQNQDVHDHDRGLAHDLVTLVDRRRALTLFAGAGLVALAACGSSRAASTASSSATSASGTSTGASATAGTSATTATAAATTAITAVATTATPSSAATDASTAIDEETAGPYPGDGSNGKNVLTQSGIVRRDIRPSLTSSKVATGVPLTVTLRIVKAGTGVALGGAAVYLWHCDIDGNYSMYSSAVASETYLRGVQETDADGNVSFTTIFPACYSGRWPHIHYEVYPSLAKATSSANKIATTQLALPKTVCDAVYATAGYSASVRNLSQVSLATDNVFSDGAERETPTMTGSVSAGLVASLVAPVRA